MSEATTRPTVHDPALQATIEQIAPHIEHLRENLDAISADIKAIEMYLDRAGVRICVFHQFAESAPTLVGAPDVLDSYSGGMFKSQETIEWCEHVPTGRWRLMYERVRVEGDFEMTDGVVLGSAFNGETQIEDQRPLIETPVEVRLRAYKAVPELLKQIGDRLAFTRTEFDPDEIPF